MAEKLESCKCRNKGTCTMVILLSVIHFLLIMIVRSGEVSGKIEENGLLLKIPDAVLGSDSNLFPFKDVYIMRRRNIFPQHEQLKIIFAKVGTGIESLEFDERRSENNHNYGYRDDEGMYSYIRLFANENTETCPFASYLRYNLPVNTSCSSSATIRTKKTTSNTALAMDITLLRGKSYTLYLLAGMMACNRPLDSLGETDSKMVATKCANNISELCPSLCKYIAKSFKPLLSFEYDVRNIQEDVIAISDSSSVKKTVCSTMSESAWDGTWNSSGWTSPCYAKPNTTMNKERSEVKPLVVNYAPLTNNVADFNYSEAKGGVCFIGDSHVGAMTRNFLKSRLPYIRYEWEWRTVSSFVFSKTIWSILKGKRSHPEDMSMAKALHLCLDALLNKPQINNNPHYAQTLIWWFGSHVPHLSLESVEKVVIEGITLLDNRLKESDQALPCVLIVGILDSQFENIPASYGSYMKFFQNSWRAEAHNGAIKRAIAKSNNTKVHFVDIFPISLAVHFEGHAPHDPVHFSSHFYHALSELLLDTAANVCEHTKSLI